MDTQNQSYNHTFEFPVDNDPFVGSTEDESIHRIDLSNELTTLIQEFLTFNTEGDLIKLIAASVA